MYEYKCKILRVVDGDTVDIDIDLGFGIWMHKERVRMMGIDTPESRTRDKEEKKFGLASKQFVKDHMPVGSMQVLKTEIDRSGESDTSNNNNNADSVSWFWPSPRLPTIIFMPTMPPYCKSRCL